MMGRGSGRGSLSGHVAAIVGVGLVFAACAGTSPPKVAPLPATTTTAATATTAPASLPAGCDGKPTRPTEVRYAEVEGVDPALLSLDVYTLSAECGSRPALVWLHGGDWNSGDKRTAIQPLADLAAQRGWVLVSVNYRLSTEGAQVVWPAHGTDVANAIAYVLEHDDEYGIDASRVAVMGHEAGGHLATMATVDPSLLAGAGASADDIGCLVAVDPEGLSLTALIDEAGEEVVLLVESVFGTEFQTFQLASPNVVLTQVDDPVADALVITRGPIEHQALAFDFADLATGHGATVEVVVAEQYDETELAAAIGDPTDTVVNAPIVAFLDRCFA